MVTVLPTIIGHRRGESSTARANARTPGDDGDQVVRIALSLSRQSAQLGATGDWTLYDGSGEHLLAHARAGDVYTVEGDGTQLALRGPGDRSSIRGPLIARPAGAESILTFNGHHYRGELRVLADGGVTVINQLGVEQYLRGVVPMEIGVDRTETEVAAVEAQAVAARSYTYTRLNDTRPYDMTATAMDQVYGGMDAEHPISDEAIRATRDQVLIYDGKVVNAPYHANSGGITAAASEVWRSGDEPYLVPVSDRIPGTDHYYCEDSPKYRWTRTLDQQTLIAALNAYLPKYADAPRSRIREVRNVTETGRTQSGRLAGLVFETDRGRFTVRGNDVRFVLRTPGGDVLPSTLFNFDVSRRDGHVTGISMTGTGNGHGVGMDQWGAIARARAGQSYSFILRTYYPGTTIGRVI
jgi:stage II sporulation protein D